MDSCFSLLLTPNNNKQRSTRKTMWNFTMRYCGGFPGTSLSSLSYKQHTAYTHNITIKCNFAYMRIYAMQQCLRTLRHCCESVFNNSFSYALPNHSNVFPSTWIPRRSKQNAKFICVATQPTSRKIAKYFLCHNRNNWTLVFVLLLCFFFFFH